MNLSQDINDISQLLDRFNKRDALAFALIYNKLFIELSAYARQLYSNTTMSHEDAVQDALCYLWERKDLWFESTRKIKAFMFVAIKNKYKSYLSHINVHNKYEVEAERDTRFIDDIYRSEFIAFISEYFRNMPNLTGKIMTLYLDGYTFEEIAETLQISIRTVYNTKSKAVGILKSLVTR